MTLVAWRMDGVDMPLDHGGFRRGWLAAETGMRWTDGDATLDVAPGSVVELCVPRILRYHVAPQSDTLRSEAA